MTTETDDKGSAAAEAEATSTTLETADTGSAAKASTETKVDAGKAETKTAEPSLLDAVKASLDKSRAQTAATGKADAGSQAKADTSTQDKKEGEEEEDRDPTEDELAAMPSNERRSTRRALRQRNEARDELRAFKAEFDAVVPEVEGFRRIVGFVNQNNLSTEEVNIGLGVMAAIKNDPETALGMLKPYYEQLLVQTGQGTLPADLQKLVDDGEITEPMARRLAAAEASKGIAAKRAETVVARTEEDRRAESQAAFTKSISDSMNAWETKLLSADPDYKQIRDVFQEKVELAVKRGQFQPRSAQDVPALLETILADTKKSLGRFRAPAAPTRDITPLRHTNGSGGHTAPKPATFADAIKSAVVGTGR